MAESVLHHGGVTTRVVGTGLFRMSLIGLDDTRTKVLAPLTMSMTPGREPFTVTNFNAQRARLKMETTAIDEYMKVNRVVIWVNELWKSLPNGGRPRV